MDVSTPGEVDMGTLDILSSVGVLHHIFDEVGEASPCKIDLDLFDLLLEPLLGLFNLSVNC